MRSRVFLLLYVAAIVFAVGGGSRAWADPVKLEAVAATTGPDSAWREAVDGVASPGNGWKVPQGQPHAAVFRCAEALKAGRLRVWLDFDGGPGTVFHEFSLSVTTDPNPGLDSHWEPVFPGTFSADQGNLLRQGEHLRFVGPEASPEIRVDYILPMPGVTGIRLESWPVAQAEPATAGLTELRAHSSLLPTTNIALGCRVTASHELWSGQYAGFLTDGLAGNWAHPASPDLGDQFYFEIDLLRVHKLDHITLRARSDSTAPNRFSKLTLDLFREKPAPESVPVWTAMIRQDSFPEPGGADVVRASMGQGIFEGRYLRISSSSAVPFSPQLAEVEVYDVVVAKSVSMKANDRAVRLGEITRVPSTTNWLTFTMVSPSANIILGKRWRILGAGHDEWLPGNAVGVFETRGLPVGEYLFELDLRHSDFQWNDATVRLPFVVLTPWWQKPAAQWAAASIAVALAALIAWRVTRYRLARRWRELERKQEVANERRRIARDMHDVVGSRLTQLTVMHELFAKQFAMPEGADRKLEELTATARAAVASLDEAVWVINPGHDAVRDLADYLCHVASDYLRPLGIAFRQNVQEPLPEITVGAQKRHELLSAFKEALQNVVKHAGATTVTLSLFFNEPDLLICLEDNGRGLPVAPSGAPAQDGLENMRARLAKNWRAVCSFHSTGRGTRVEMRFTP